MFDCSKEITLFHNEKVALPQLLRSDLRDKRDANRERLKSGLTAEEEPTPTGMWSQGSYAMHTMVQAEENDFDIDDGVYFKKDDLVDSNGFELDPYLAKEMVRKAVNHHSLNTPPEIKDNCVRVHYEKGYHIDIPVYRTTSEDGKEFYELASATSWKISDPRAVTEWFNESNKEQSPDETNGLQMRRVVKLLKDFVKSNTTHHEEGPSGFIISKLVQEEYEPHLGRDDKSLYYTMRNIHDRLKDKSLEVDHPVVDEKLTAGEYDPTTTLFRTQLNSAMDELQVLFETQYAGEALTAWGKVFKDQAYFSKQASMQTQESASNSAHADDDSESSSIWVKSDENVSPVDKKGGEGMPDAGPEINFLSDKHQQGIKRLELFLNEKCSSKPIRLNERQTKKHAFRDAVAGWAIQPPDIAQRLHIFVDSRYPFSVPKIAVFPEPRVLTYPHIEEDGYLCISEVAVPKSEEDLEAVAHDVIAEAVSLLKQCFSGENQKDFKDEILSYWDRAKTVGAPQCFSLLNLDTHKVSRFVKIWKGIGDKRITFVADTEDEGQQWLNQKFYTKHKPDSEDAIFVWSDKILLPKEYPQNNQNVCNLLKQNCGQNAFGLFQKLASHLPHEINIIIGFQTDAGKGLVSVITGKPTQKELIKGFRPGYLPPTIAGQRYSTAKILAKRLTVQRVDPSWILSRDSDIRIPKLQNKTVTIVGCGSIGSEVARFLAQNGIHRFNLIDHDSMDWENIGRHALGAEAIHFAGRTPKASALGDALKEQFPHIHIRATYLEKWENALKTDTKAFHDADLIIMATGDWPAENAMNKYSLSQETFPPILYGWAEAYAAAGHSFAVLKNSGCFNCAFNNTSFKFKLSIFNEEQRRLPACGGVFQPLRSIELAPVNSMIAGHAIDILMCKITKSQIRSWIGSHINLRENGGTWTEIAQQTITDIGAASGQFQIQRDFDKISDCKTCTPEVE